MINIQNLPKRNFTPTKNIPYDGFKKNNTLSFTSKHTMNVNLKNSATKSTISAQVVELDYSPNDDRLISNLNTLWSKTQFMDIISDFYHRGKNKKFFVIALGNDNKIETKGVKSILQVENKQENGERVCKIDFIQSAPEIADNKTSSIRGAGEIALYTAVDYAKKTGCKKVALASTNNGFYEKAGFQMGEKKNP